MVVERRVPLRNATTNTPQQFVSNRNSFDAWEAKTCDILSLFTPVEMIYEQSDS